MFLGWDGGLCEVKASQVYPVKFALEVVNKHFQCSQQLLQPWWFGSMRWGQSRLFYSWCFLSWTRGSCSCSDTAATGEKDCLQLLRAIVAVKNCNLQCLNSDADWWCCFRRSEAEMEASAWRDAVVFLWSIACSAKKCEIKCFWRFWVFYFYL